MQDKIYKAQIKYKKIKDEQHTPGTERQDWRIFDKMDAVLGTRYATEPPITIDTSIEHQDDTPKEPAANDQATDKPELSHSSLQKEAKDINQDG